MPVDQRGGGALVQRREQLRTVPRADAQALGAASNAWVGVRGASCAAAAGRPSASSVKCRGAPPAGRGGRAAWLCRETAARPACASPVSGAVETAGLPSARWPAPRSAAACSAVVLSLDDEAGAGATTTTPPTTTAAAATSSPAARRRRWAAIGTTTRAAAGRAGATDGTRRRDRRARRPSVPPRRRASARCGEPRRGGGVPRRSRGTACGTIVGHGAPPSPACGWDSGGLRIGRAGPPGPVPGEPRHGSRARSARRSRSRVARRSRPREHRDFTVPSAQSSITRHLGDRSSPPCRPAPAPRAARPAAWRARRGRRAAGRRDGGLLRVVGRAGGGARSTRGRRCSSRSSGRASVRRTFAARRRSRQALTTTRCSQVVTAASPRKRVRPAVRRDQAVLQAVGGVVRIAHGAQGHRPQPVAVPGEERGRTRRGHRRRERPAARRRCGRPSDVVTLDHHLGDCAAEPAGDRRAARSARPRRIGRWPAGRRTRWPWVPVMSVLPATWRPCSVWGSVGVT